MGRILIIAEHDGSSLNTSTGKCVTCAAGIENDGIDIAVFASAGAEVAAQAATLEGVSRVMVVDNPANAKPLAAIIAPQVVALAEPYSHILGSATTFGKDLMPRVAALLGVGQISDIMAVIGPYTFQRPVYAGEAIVTVESPADRKLVGTVRGASYKAAASGGSAAVEPVAVDAALPTHTRYGELSAAASDRPDLQTASRVVCGGRALGSKEKFELIFNLADKLGAAVGATRAAVDAGYVPNETQVGQTGKIIAPELYIAFGISGAIQHVTGIKDAGTIVAVNKDPEAPIFEIADIGLVGDLFTIIPELQARLG
jgi:electron transfer flavoprotein alpha subunit